MAAGYVLRVSACNHVNHAERAHAGLECSPMLPPGMPREWAVDVSEDEAVALPEHMAVTFIGNWRAGRDRIDPDTIEGNWIIGDVNGRVRGIGDSPGQAVRELVNQIQGVQRE